MPEITPLMRAVARVFFKVVDEGHGTAQKEVKEMLDIIAANHCTCVNWCVNPPFPGGCEWCTNMDPYDPCPVIGFGCGAAPNGPPCECCTEVQRHAAAGGAR